MPTVVLSPTGNDAPFVDSSGNPLSGGKLFFYAAGTTTPQDTYTTSAGSVANANPVILNANGYPASGGNVVQIWLVNNYTYKAVLKTSADVTIWTRDNIAGINDSSFAATQWVTGPVPTYVSATSFTLAGDQTSNFQVGRRIKTTNTGGTVYSTISTSAYTSLTTVTVINDLATLDSGLSAVSYGLVSSIGSSVFHYGTTDTIFTFDGSGGSTGSLTLRWNRAGYLATLFVPAALATSGTGSTALDSVTALPTGIRPVRNQQVPMGFVTNNNAQAAGGILSVLTTGIVRIKRDNSATAFTNTATGGAGADLTVSFSLQ